MKRRNLLISAGLIVLFVALYGLFAASPSKNQIKFYVGSSGNQAHAIYLCEMSPQTLEFTLLDSFSGAEGASYLALSPGKEFLFCNSRTPAEPGNHMSAVSSFQIHPRTKQLEFLSSKPSMGQGNCHVHCSQDGKYLFAANYNSGHAAAFPLDKQGNIGDAVAVVRGKGSGPVENRQQGPHAHQVVLDPGQNFLLVPDLGTDKVMIYQFFKESGSLAPHPVKGSFSLAPGAGPRHLVFHPDGAWLYIVNELNSTLTAGSWDAEKGALAEIQTLSTVEEGHRGMKYPAAVRMHPSGKYVYASTRGENSCISTFSVQKDGSLHRIQVMEDVPLWPRDFNIDPTGRWLIAAGERANEIRLYAIDPETGKLSDTGSTKKLSAPACIAFL